MRRYRVTVMRYWRHCQLIVSEQCYVTRTSDIGTDHETCRFFCTCMMTCLQQHCHMNDVYENVRDALLRDTSTLSYSDSQYGIYVAPSQASSLSRDDGFLAEASASHLESILHRPTHNIYIFHNKFS